MKGRKKEGFGGREGYKLGFTLIELVVVIAIIATLTALATANFNQARIRARDVQRKSELRAIRDALELYKNDQNPQSYPATVDLLVSGYMAKLPVDPKEKAVNDSWQDYAYTRDVTDSLKYTLTACLENAGDPDATATVCETTGRVHQLTQP